MLVGTGDEEASSIADELYQDRASVLVTAAKAPSNALLPYV